MTSRKRRRYVVLSEWKGWRPMTEHETDKQKLYWVAGFAALALIFLVLWLRGWMSDPDPVPIEPVAPPPVVEPAE